MKNEFEKFDITSIDISQFHADAGETDPIHEIASALMRERHEIIDLFCQTFLAVQDPPSIEALKDLFDMIELECTLESNMTQTFRIKLRETITPNKDGNNETV